MEFSNSVTVILPVYNGARYFRDAFQSVLLQSRSVQEVVIINDGSTDDSAEVIERTLAEFEPTMSVTVLHQENQGQSAARNVGVEHSTGSLLAFLDQDDLWSERHIEVLASYFDGEAGLGWAYSDFDEIDGKGRLVTRGFIKSNNLQHPKTTVHDILREDNMVVPSASIIRRSALLDVGGFDPRLRGYEDDDLFIRIFQSGWSAQFIPSSLASFRVHAGSSSDGSSFRTSRMIFFEKMSESFPDDLRLNRLYVSDLLVPRLLNSTVSEYRIALHLRRFGEARLIAESIKILLAGGARRRLRSRLGVALLRRPRLCLIVLRVRQALPRVFRPAISPALVLRY